VSTPGAASLYTLLAEEAPESSERGETIYTATKETVDNDREAFVSGLLDG
jgi:hypothetical protein